MFDTTRMALIAALTTAAGLVSAQQFNQPTTVGTPFAGATPIPQGIPFNATIPVVVSSNPSNGSQTVNPRLDKITITFNQPMDVATFYWPVPTGVSDFPEVTRDSYWINGNRTVVLPVRLNPYTLYRIPINQSGLQIFRSAQGVPCQNGLISFRTARSSGTSVKPGFGPPTRTTQPQQAGTIGGTGNTGSSSSGASTRSSQTGSQSSSQSNRQSVRPGATPTPTPRTKTGSPTRVVTR